MTLSTSLASINDRSSKRGGHDGHTKVGVRHQVATLAYLGLAILGWGGFEAFFSHPPLTALAIALLVLSGVQG